MADVSHELGALRFVVESPLSSKVAMFNNAVSKHQESQHLNPFSQSGGLPRPTFNKGEYGKPLAGSLTEMRGQKANIHVLKEMLELCQIIDSEGYNVKDEPNMKVIPFGELFNIYTYISDKVVGILLRARKHKLIEFEGEVLFQRRDDDVPVFLLKPIKEIRQILEQKQDEIRRSVSPAPQATSVMLDNKMRSASASPTPSKSKASKPAIVKPVAKKAEVAMQQTTPEIKVEQPPKEDTTKLPQAPAPAPAPAPTPATTPTPTPAPEQIPIVTSPAEQEPAPASPQPAQIVAQEVSAPSAAEQAVEAPKTTSAVPESVATPPETIVTPPTPTAESAPAVVITPAASEPSPAIVEEKTDINNNEEAPAIVATTVEPSSNAEAQLPAEVSVSVPNVA